MSSKIQHLRRVRGMTAYAFARAIGVRENQVYAWERERSRPSIESALAASRFLDAPVQELFPQGVRS